MNAVSGADVLGVILAGGQARRMGGGDKALVELAGRPMLAHAIDRLAPQVSQVIVNANGDPARFDRFRVPVVADTVAQDDGGFAGPLAGVLAGMAWAAVNAPEHDWIATVAVDAPFFPKTLVSRLAAAIAAEDADLACAASGGRAHPVFGLWPVRLAEDLRRALAEEGIRKVDAWTTRYRIATIEFPVSVVDPFFNANRPGDLAEAERIAADLNGSKPRDELN